MLPASLCRHWRNNRRKGRMPLPLIIAFVVSLGLHAAALFGPDFDLSTEPETSTILA